MCKINFAQNLIQIGGAANLDQILCEFNFAQNLIQNRRQFGSNFVQNSIRDRDRDRVRDQNAFWVETHGLALSYLRICPI